MRRALGTLALLLGLPLSAAACLWDRDTAADEARGLPEVVAVIAGRFARNPPLFYEMRLKRVAAHLAANPDDLAAYDDAGVASDRLGRGDEAIAWMEKKHARLAGHDPANGAVQEQLYRYHANLGTFLVHRWVRQGADRAQLDQVKAARDEIARALEINPKAHFGRERYQLRALEWIIDPPKPETWHGNLPNLLGWSIDDVEAGKTDPKQADDAVRGLAGLIVLGNAWESVDVFHALDMALRSDSVGYDRGPLGGRNTLAYLAELRASELIDAGKGSMLPDSPRGDALKAMLRGPHFVDDEQPALEAAFRSLRAEADAWQAARTAFMIERLEQGRHPDTDPQFWDGYTERPAPELPAHVSGRAFVRRWQTPIIVALVVAFVIAILLLAVVVGLGLRAIRRRARSAGEPAAGAPAPSGVGEEIIHADA